MDERRVVSSGLRADDVTYGEHVTQAGGLCGGTSQGRRGRGRKRWRRWGIRVPDERRAQWVANDTAALEAAWTTALSEGPVAHDLRAWRVPCLIFMAAADNDFLEQARKWLHYPLFNGNYAMLFTIAFAWSVLVASASYFAVEQPILRLKDRR